MGKASDAVNAIMTQTSEKVDDSPDNAANLEMEGIWSAILELANRVDAAPDEAIKEINKQIRRAGI